jgi:IclR family mhp operon transcriptional activator
MEKGIPIRAISRSIAVLQAINRAGSLSMVDIAAASGVPYPTAYRIVQTLLHEGLIEREPTRKCYRPTPLVQTLSHGFEGHGRLVTAARSHIVALTHKVGWPISLATHVGHRMVIRDSTHSLTSLTFNNYYPGYTLPILECASGRVFLAFVGDEERRGLLATLRAIPANAENQALRLFESGALAAEIRRHGFATKGRNRYTKNPGKTSSIAVPIFDRDGIAGALTLIVFASSMSISDAVERYVDDLRMAAEKISLELLGTDHFSQSAARAESGMDDFDRSRTVAEAPARPG